MPPHRQPSPVWQGVLVPSPTGRLHPVHVSSSLSGPLIMVLGNLAARGAVAAARRRIEAQSRCRGVCLVARAGVLISATPAVRHSSAALTRTTNPLPIWPRCQDHIQHRAPPRRGVSEGVAGRFSADDKQAPWQEEIEKITFIARCGLSV